MSLDRESELSLAADAPVAADFLAGRDGTLYDATATDPGTWWRSSIPPRSLRRPSTRASAGASTPAPRRRSSSPRRSAAARRPRGRPVVPGYRPTSLDICKPFTAEGFAIHPGLDPEQPGVGSGR